VVFARCHLFYPMFIDWKVSPHLSPAWLSLFFVPYLSVLLWIEYLSFSIFIFFPLQKIFLLHSTISPQHSSLTGLVFHPIFFCHYGFLLDRLLCVCVALFFPCSASDPAPFPTLKMFSSPSFPIFPLWAPFILCLRCPFHKQEPLVIFFYSTGTETFLLLRSHK